MLLGKITGNLVSTKKLSALVGCKFMKVKIESTSEELVAIDAVGAGIGDEVLVTRGHNAMYALTAAELPVDAVIVGIVD